MEQQSQTILAQFRPFGVHQNGIEEGVDRAAQRGEGCHGSGEFFISDFAGDVRSHLAQRQCQVAFGGLLQQGGVDGTVEFAGPYPVTDKEFRLLDGFRRAPSKKPEGL